MSNALKWIWLSEKCGQGSSEVLTLVEKFASIDEIYDADYDKYSELGISEHLAETLCDKALDNAQKIINYCQSAGVGLLTYDGYDYPTSLRSLKNPPVVLYYMGTLPNFNRSLCISIVGTRKMSEYGMRAAYKISYEVASAGAIVVSGMALGIDGIASCAAIAAKGKTIAVLGCGIDVVYPKEHEKLESIIKQNGAVITEYPPSTEPRGSNFPMRNRIISGLSQGTVVVDADKGSGALITAKNAILQGKDIYAVPANIDADNSSGTNMLIRDGAQAVMCGNDIIRNYMFIYRDRLDVQKMISAEAHSEFDGNVVKSMGVAVRVYTPTAQKQGGFESLHKAEGRKRSPYARKESKRTEPAKANNEDKTDQIKHHEAPPSPQKSSGDDSAKVLEKLTEKQRRVFDEMPLDRAVTVDYLTKTGFTLGEVISALTVLEIKGLVSSLPGALYIRR